MNPWLTIVMPVHFGADFIGSALASVASESPVGVEVRIYNSADDKGAARRVAERFSDQLSIIWQEREEIKSWTGKTNLGVSETEAPYIAMLHQDDLWLPGHLAAIRQSISDDPEAAMSIGSSRFADAKGRLLSAWKLPFSPGSYEGTGLFEALLVQNSIAIPSPVIKREAWLACGGLDDALWYTADWDLYLKLTRTGRIVVRPEATTAFRLHGGSLTMAGRSDLDEFRLQLESVLTRHLEDFPDTSDTQVLQARASIDINCALAATSAGKPGTLPGALLALARLGPRGLSRYFAQSRIIDRVYPRLKLKLTRGF